MKEQEVLSEANKLVGNSLRGAAIDLLLEYVETNPDSPIVLRALGRVYMLNNQPDKAIVHLRRSLEVTESRNSNSHIQSEYQSESFSDDDMAFVETLAETLSEDEYRFGFEDEVQVAASHEGKIDSNVRQIITTESPGLEGEEPKINSNSIGNVDVKAGAISDGDDVIAKPEDNSLNSFQEGAENPFGTYPNDEDEEVELIEESGKDSFEKSEQLLFPDITPIIETLPQVLDFTELSDEISEVDESFYPDLEDIVEIDSKFSDELFDVDDEALGEEKGDELSPPIPLPDIEEDDELSWDDLGGLDDLDEFDELAHRDDEEEVESQGKISREERARQVAAEVLEVSGWDALYLVLLQKIFMENGWSASRVAIDREVNKGLYPEELKLAREIRLLWSQNERYWITFQRIKYNAPFQQAVDAYRHMSWPEALRIVRCFSSFPDIEEIYKFIEDSYDDWYCSDHLRRRFKIFFKYFKYRTGSMRRTLPGDCPYSFLDPMEADVGVDSNNISNQISPARQELMEFGLQIDQWPRPPENKIKVIKGLLE